LVNFLFLDDASRHTKVYLHDFAMSTTDFERLERLEQSITLCLQEIDHNFIRCHRVATACLPVVERYAEQSRAVWDGAKVNPHPFPSPWNQQRLTLRVIVLETIL